MDNTHILPQKIFLAVHEIFWEDAKMTEIVMDTEPVSAAGASATVIGAAQLTAM